MERIRGSDFTRKVKVNLCSDLGVSFPASPKEPILIGRQQHYVDCLMSGAQGLGRRPCR